MTKLITKSTQNTVECARLQGERHRKTRMGYNNRFVEMSREFEAYNKGFYKLNKIED